MAFINGDWATQRRRQLLFVSVLLAVGGVYFVVAAAAGRQLLISGRFWPSDILWGSDVGRTIRAMTEPGITERSNVHPLFSVCIRPLTALLRLFGITAGTSAVLLNAAAGAAGLLLLAAYLRLRGTTRIDALLGVLLLASSSSWLLQSAVPGTFIFSLCIIGLSQILLLWTLRRPDPTIPRPLRRAREGTWLLTGLLNFGFALTNGFFSFLAYGFARRSPRGWLRAAVYGAVVLGLGLALAPLVGSLSYYRTETIWLYDNPLRGHTAFNPFGHSLSVNLFWSYLAPLPTFDRTADERQWVCLTFLNWHYTAWGWCLVAVWAAILAAAVWAILTDRAPDGRRLSAALAAGLAFQIILHSWLYVAFEGVFQYSAHGIFLSAALLAPLLARLGRCPRAPRWGLRLAFLLFIAALAWRNIELLYSLKHLVPLPPGFPGQ